MILVRCWILFQESGALNLKASSEHETRAAQSSQSDQVSLNNEAILRGHLVNFQLGLHRSKETSEYQVNPTFSQYITEVQTFKSKMHSSKSHHYSLGLT